MRIPRWGTTLALAVGIALVGPASVVQAASATTLGPAVHVWHMSVRVPAGWTLNGPNRSYGTTTWTLSGSSGQVQLASTPLSPHDDPEQLLPWANGRFVFRSPQGPGGMMVQLVTQNGTEDRLTVQLNHPDAALTRAIINSWTHPQKLTVTGSVVKLEHIHNRYSFYDRSYGTARDGWILAGGEVAGPAESWDLFETKNHGKTWTLEKYTGTGRACQPADAACHFLFSAGDTALRFWNARDGVLAQAEFAYNGASVYWTSDGGKVWRSTLIHLPSEPQAVAIARSKGVLRLTVEFSDHLAKEVWLSQDGGASWRESR